LSDGSSKRFFDIKTDLALLRPILEKADNPQLLVIDPLTAYAN
jgi:hypothetical protein